ncbi:MAG: tetratricopeptide repeat protein [Thermodesulfobacteriota bacterium]|nr:tetratricopeptide repeat protein [Thermodesulfobacteriota bacterium]
MEHTSVTQDDARGRRKRLLIICLLLASALGIVYAPALNHGFLKFDDDTYVTENPHVKDGLTLEGARWAFSRESPDTYWHPLTWLSLMLDTTLFGPSPAGYHFTNLLLHLLGSLLLFLFFHKTTGALPPSALVAALFALHPINVESVAWVVERKNVLSTFLWFLALFLYARFAARPNITRYLGVAFSLALGLLAKPMLVTVPFLLLLLDYWPLGRTRFSRPGGAEAWSAKDTLSRETPQFPASRLILEKIPLFALCLSSAAMTYLSQPVTGTSGSVGAVPMGLRLSNALVSFAAYVWKAVWPTDLAVFYPFPESVPAWKTLAAGAFVAGLTGFCVWAARKRPYLLVGWLWYLGTLVPVLGIVQHGLWPAMADRFAYVPLVGLYIPVAFRASELSKATIFSNRPLRNAVFFGAAGLVLTALMLCSRQQLRYWRGTTTLFKRAIAVTKNNWAAHFHMGLVLALEGKEQEAISHYQKAVQIKPNFAQAHNNLGNLLTTQGKLDLAEANYRKALEANPLDAKTHYNLGGCLEKQGRHEEAAMHYQKALQGMPRKTEIPKAMKEAMRKRQGKGQPALPSHKMSPDMPKDAKSFFDLGNFFAGKGEYEQSVTYYKKALRMRPAYADAYNNLGASLTRLGRESEAREAFLKALEANPKHGPARKNLQELMRRSMKKQEQP